MNARYLVAREKPGLLPTADERAEPLPARGGVAAPSRAPFHGAKCEALRALVAQRDVQGRRLHWIDGTGYLCPDLGYASGPRDTGTRRSRATTRGCA
jgi:hypothetical protein